MGGSIIVLFNDILIIRSIPFFYVLIVWLSENIQNLELALNYECFIVFLKRGSINLNDDLELLIWFSSITSCSQGISHSNLLYYYFKYFVFILIFLFFRFSCNFPVDCVALRRRLVGSL